MAIEIPSFHNVFLESDPHASTPASIDLVCMLVAFMRPAVVVEAGTYQGHMAVAIANVFRKLGHPGLVYTADVTDVVSDSLKHELLDPVRPHIRFHLGDFREMLDGIAEPVDLAYIDASHKDSPHLRWTHARAAYDRLRLGGLILVDDTEGNWEAAAWFRGRADDAGIHLTHHRGLTILQKKEHIPWL